MNSPILSDTSRVTIRDVAQIAGVSPSTVSRVLNGRHDVSEETRQAVLTVVREHGFSVNRSAKGLSDGRTGLVGVAVPFLQTAYFAAIIAGAADALYDEDRRIVLCPTQHEHDREVGLLERLMHGTTEGALLLLPTESNRELRALWKRGYRFVVVDPRTTLADEIPSVSSDHGQGANQVMEHLLGLGHRKIAAITGPKTWVASAERLNGYYAGLARAGIVQNPDYVAEADFEIEGGIAAAKRLLDLPDRPTAVFAFNDGLALGAVLAARSRGLRVPEDLSVVGYDDTEVAPALMPPLTSVRQPLAEMGRMAVALLLRLLEDKNANVLSVELATKLVVRESTAPPPP
jgi:LacI family transcriptional regulator, galactose operon repressor